MSLINVAMRSRSIDTIIWLSDNRVDLSSYVTVLESFISDLLSLKLEVVNHLDEWDECGINRLFTANNIPIWNTEKNFTIENKNLIDVMDSFVLTAKEFLKKTVEKADYKKELGYLMINGFGRIWTTTQKLIEEVEMCAETNARFISSQIKYLYAGVGIVIIFCILILIIFAKIIENIKNTYWSALRDVVYESKQKVLQDLLDRINQIHKKQLEVNLTELLKSSTKTVEFGNFSRYLWRILLYMLVSGVFLAVVAFYLQQQTTEILNSRPEILENLIKQRSCMSQVFFWAKEKSISRDYPLWDAFRNYEFSNPATAMDKAIYDVRQANHLVRNSKYTKYYNRNQTETIFESINSNHKFLNKGMLAATNYLISEAIYTEWSFLDNIDLLVKSHADTKTLEIYYNNLIEDIEKETKRLLELNLSNVILITSLYCLFLILLHFCIFLPFLAKEKDEVARLSVISKIINQR